MKINYNTKKVIVEQRMDVNVNRNSDEGYCTITYKNEDGNYEEKKILKSLTAIVPSQEIEIVCSGKDNIIAYKIENENKIHWIEDVSRNFKESYLVKILKFIFILVSFIPFFSFLPITLSVFISDNNLGRNPKNIINIIERELKDYFLLVGYFLTVIISLILSININHEYMFNNEYSISKDLTTISISVINSILFSCIFYYRNKKYYDTYALIKKDIEDKFNCNKK